MIRLKRNTGGNDSIPSIGGNSHETAIIAIFRSIHISRERNQQKPQAVRREAFHESLPFILFTNSSASHNYSIKEIRYDPSTCDDKPFQPKILIIETSSPILQPPRYPRRINSKRDTPARERCIQPRCISNTVPHHRQSHKAARYNALSAQGTRT